jgi:hypothetical protein
MTGITTRSMPLLIVENRAFGNRAVCALNEGLGKVMRFGGNDAEVLARLAWLRDEFGPLMGQALRHAGGVPLNPLIARGLAMGDEMHQRNVACTSLLTRTLAPSFAEKGSGAGLVKALQFVSGNDQFFLNVAMAMGKSITDPAQGIAHSTVVTVMCRNGTDFGVRVAGLEGWFTAPVEMPQGLYFPGFSAADANPDIGDSAILETIGLGAFAMAAAPAVTRSATRAPWERSRSRGIRSGPSRRSSLPARRPASTSAASPKPASRRRSTPASPTARRASARSARAWRVRRSHASSRRSRRLLLASDDCFQPN